MRSIIHKSIVSNSVTDCPVCLKGSSTSEVIQLPSYPLTELFSSHPPKEDYVSSTTLDQTFCYCASCSHGYLREKISPKFLYSKENYNTVTTLSQGSLISIDNFASFISRNSETCSVYSIDIGGNDSNLLRKIGRIKGCIIDPNASSDSADFKCMNEFVEFIDPNIFEHSSVEIVSSHTLEHIDDPHVFFTFVKRIKNASSVFIQVPCLELMVQGSRYDLIHHQHLHYFSLRSISKLAKMYGFLVNEYEYDVDHYGTLRVHLVADDHSSSTTDSLNTDYCLDLSASSIATQYEKFSSICSMQSLHISKLPSLYCYGASLMLPIVFYYFPCLTENCLGILDQDKNKSNIWFANICVPIVYDDQMYLSDKSLVISAVATRSACRNIVKNIINRNPLHMFIPFGEF
jgi:hypothetical protein